MNPIYLGNTQCFNVDNQCYAGEEFKSKLDGDKVLSKAFSESCKENDPTNVEMRCCPLALINRPYVPTVGRMPIHVKKTGDKHEICPEAIQSQCVREEGDNFILCVAQKCNDAGYLEAENYYQICKGFNNPDGTQAPDCPIKKCEKMMEIPSWYANQLSQGITPELPSELAAERAGPLQIPKYSYYYKDLQKKKEEKDKGFTLRDLFSKLPKQEGFYSWGALILGILAVIIIVTVWFLMPRQPYSSFPRLT